jgi:hypothetical protein
VRIVPEQIGICRRRWPRGLFVKLAKPISFSAEGGENGPLIIADNLGYFQCC